MMRKFTYLLAAIAVFIVGAANAQQTVKKTDTGIYYLEYLPDGYKSSTADYPVVISLHGIKEKGNTAEDCPRVANVGLAKLVKYGYKYPFILISPQLKTSIGGWPADYVMQVVNYVKKTMRIDERRIHLTGLSLGGYGVWKTVAAYPAVFASVSPICSGGNALSRACDIAAQDVAAWGFHGLSDGTVNYQVTLKMINAINACTPAPTPLAKVTLYPGLGHAIWDKVYKESGVTDWIMKQYNGSTSSTTPENAPPVANAGGDITKVLPENSAIVSGSGSDQEGSIASYVWSQVSGPNAAALTNKTTAKLTASSLVAGAYTFRLKVTDSKGAYDTDDVKVTVTTSSTNVAPVISAGTDKTITLPTNSLYLQGTATDSDGTIASYQWTKTAGGTASLSGTSSSKLTVSNLVAGTYTFKFTVKDNDGAYKSDYVNVVVKSSGNLAPIAKAGSDKAISTYSTKIYGSGTDSDGKVVYYKWYKVSGPGAYLYGVSKPTLELSKLAAGTYKFRLTVTDDKGATGVDYMTLTVGSSTASL
jgi:dienelactone hydrolase